LKEQANWHMWHPVQQSRSDSIEFIVTDISITQAP
jgi:hypothetical protein